MRQRPGRQDLVKKPRSALWHLGLSGFVVAGAIAVALYSLWRDRPQPETALTPTTNLPAPAPATDGLHFADVFYSDIDYALEELGLWPELVRKERHSDIDRIEVKVPADLPLVEVNLALTLAAQARGGHVLNAVETRAGKRVEMRFAFATIPTTAIDLTRTTERRRTGRIAIVLDDFGSDSRLVERFCALQQSLTLALRPNAGPVRAIAERALQHGHQVIVHLPKALRRDAFIDEIDERQAIENKLWDLAKMAGRTGAVIAIAHDRENTLLALESVLPRLETRGFRFEVLDQLLP